MPSSATTLSPAELSYLHTSLSSTPPIRPDSRTATDFRALNAETGILPNTMGSAHVGFADGREAVVGVRAEVEKTVVRGRNEEREGEDVTMMGDERDGRRGKRMVNGRKDWVSLGLTLPGLRDDDVGLVFLEEMLREVLFSSVEERGREESAALSLQDALVINLRWHWRLYVDVLLISAPDQASSSTAGGGGGGGSGTAGFPLPLLSMAVHLALRDTRLPRLKSEGDEDPLADDDWEAAVCLYERGKKIGLLRSRLVPPVTLLVMIVADNVIFDPSATELAVADCVCAVSVGRVGQGSTGDESIRILGVRSLETPARDTMKGVSRDAVEEAGQGLQSGNDVVVPGVWKPKVGGIKRAVLMKVVKSVVTGGVGREVFEGLDGFVGAA